MMDFDRPEAVKTVKALLGIAGDEEDTLLALLVDESVGYTLGYCRRETIPESLKSVIPMMAADLYRTKMYGTKEAKAVKSVTQGERSVTYEVNSTSNVFSAYHSRLKPYIRRCARLPSEVDHDKCL